MSGRNQSAQAPQQSPIDMSLYDDNFDDTDGQFDFTTGSGYVDPEANTFDFNATSNIDPALTATNNLAAPTANSLQQFQSVPQYAPPFTSNPADWPRPTDAHYHPAAGWYRPVPAPADWSKPGNAFYNPAVGWYVPVGPLPAASVGYASPPLMGQPPAMYNQLPTSAPMAPVASTFHANTSLSADPSASAGRKRKAQGNSFSRERSRARSQKRKYGPSAYLDEQANKRARGDNSGPGLSHRESVNYGSSPASRRQTPEQKKAARAARATRRPRKTSDVGLSTKKIGQLNAATIQPCSCPAARQVKANHIKRARNAFFVFRGDFSAKRRAPRKGKGKQNDMANVSTAAGEIWRGMSAAEKAPYAERAKQEAAEHKQAYPDYQYNPSKGIEAKFGKPDCKCGAYQANMTELRIIHGEGELEPIEEEEEDQDNVTLAQPKGPMTRSRSRSLSASRKAQAELFAPTAQMQQTFSFVDPALNDDQYGYSLDFTLPPTQTGFGIGDAFTPGELGEQPQVHFDASTFMPTQGGYDQAQPRRRSPRQNSKATYYDAAPVTEDPAFFEQFNDLLNEDFSSSIQPKSPSPKRRPTPISTSDTRRPSNLFTIPEVGDLGFSLADIEGPPATRTRSKSVSRSPSSRKTPTSKGTSFSPTGRKASTPKTPSPKNSAPASKTSSPKNDSVSTPEGDFDDLFGEGVSASGTPKSAVSSKASPKTVKAMSSGLALPVPKDQVVSGRITRSKSRGRARKRS